MTDRCETVLFEESILSILPSTCFLLLAPLQTFKIFKSATAVKSSLLCIAKLVCVQRSSPWVTLGLPCSIASNLHLWWPTTRSTRSTVLAILLLESVIGCLLCPRPMRRSGPRRLVPHRAQEKPETLVLHHHVPTFFCHFRCCSHPNSMASRFE